MSGGHFEYKDFHIHEIADEVENLICNNDSQEMDDFGYPIGRNYSPEVIEKFKQGYHHLRMAEIYAHRIDWLVSGDDGERNFLKRLAEDLEAL